MMFQLRHKILKLCDGLTQSHFDIQNIYSYIENLSTGTINTTLIHPSHLQYLLYNIKDQLRSHPRLALPVNIDSDIRTYYEFLKIQAFISMDTLFVIWTIPLVNESLTFCLYRICNLPLLHPMLLETFQWKMEQRNFAIRSNLHYISFPDD